MAFLFLADPASTIIHSIRFLQEDYYKDYQDVRKRRFKARKLEIEQKVSEVFERFKFPTFLVKYLGMLDECFQIVKLFQKLEKNQIQTSLQH